MSSLSRLDLGQGYASCRGPCYRCMMGKRTIKPAEITAKRFTVGRVGFAKISAVEGISLTREMERDFEAFDAESLTAEERRRAIIGKYGKRPD